MSLRNQPYFPLYVQDFMTDEKLNMCSWQTQGIYIKILCVLHKQEKYGSILFKQKDKQNLSKVFSFASILIKHIPCDINDMISALDELVEYGVIQIEDDTLLQKRMFKDGLISEQRSKAGKKGGGNPILFKQKDKQTDKQNPEYENEYKYKDKNEDNIKELVEKNNFEKIKIESNRKRLQDLKTEYETKIGDNESGYVKFINYLLTLEGSIDHILLLNQLVTFENYCELRLMAKNKGKAVRDKLDFLVNTPSYLQNKKSLYLTLRGLLTFEK